MNEPNYGKLLKTLRRDKGLGREDMAKIAGVSLTQYGRVETGKRGIKMSTLKLILDHFEIDFKEFIK